LTITNLPLTQAPPGHPVRLIEIDAGKALRHRLTELGLTPGVTLTVVQDDGGPLLVTVRESRVALGRGMAEKILVREIGE
jgi:ferrous iron transport protein A